MASAAHIACVTGVGLIVVAIHASSSPPFLVLFGDSLSDQGNMLALSSGSEPNPGMYWSGRFTDGPAWPDVLAPAFVNSFPSSSPSTVINYAIGGATACPGTPLKQGGTVQDQVDRFAQGSVPYKDVGFSFQGPTEAALQNLLGQPNATSNSTATGWQTGNRTAALAVLIGSNDWIGALVSAVAREDEDIMTVLQDLPALVVNCTMAAVRQLVQLVSRPADPRRYARSMAPPPGPVQTLMVANVPPIEVTPLVTSTAPPLLVAAIQQSLQVYNSRLQQEVRKLAAEQGDGAPRVGYFDLYTAILQIRNAAAASGVSDVSNACLAYGLAMPILRTLVTRDVLVGQAAEASQHNTTLPGAPPKSPQSTLGAAVSLASGASTSTTAPPGGPSINLLNTTLIPVTAVCSDPDSRFFYDAVHPTTKVHRLAAFAIQKGLIDASLGKAPLISP